jgi:hypothetical protein
MDANTRTVVRGCLLPIAALVVTGVVVSAALFAVPRLTGPDSASTGQAAPRGAVAVQVPAGDVLPASRWPTACQFLDDSEILAVLPGATELNELPGGASTRTIDEFARDPSYREEEYAPEGRCTWSLKLPGERVNAFTFISFELLAVADPDLIARYHDEQIGARGGGTAADKLPDGTSCYLSGLYDARLVCARGPVMYELGGSTTTDFGDYRAYSHWRDTVLRELAITVSAKIKAA